MSNSLKFYEEAVVNAHRAKAKAKANLRQIIKQRHAQSDVIKQTWQDIKHYQDNLVSSELQQDAEYVELCAMQDHLSFKSDQYKKIIKKSNKLQKKFRAEAEVKLHSGQQTEAKILLKQAARAKRKAMGLSSKQDKLKTQQKIIEEKLITKQCAVFPELKAKLAEHEEAKRAQHALRLSYRNAKKHLQACQEDLDLAQKRYQEAKKAYNQDWKSVPCELCGRMIRVHKGWKNPPTQCNACKRLLAQGVQPQAIPKQKISKTVVEQSAPKKTRICCYRCRKIIFVSGNEKYCPDCKNLFAFINQSR